MRIYSVHQGPGRREGEGTVLVRDSFAIWAFLFPMGWLFVKRLWLALGVVFAIQVIIAALEADGVVPAYAAASLQLCVGIFVGLEGRNWLRAKLARNGFTEQGVSIGRNCEEAEARWFARGQP